MADPADKYPDNAAGAFYVDDQCIDCDACRATAPAFFQRNNDNGYSYVAQQPVTDTDRAKCQEALDGCPVEAIGSDGA